LTARCGVARVGSHEELMTHQSPPSASATPMAMPSTLPTDDPAEAHGKQTAESK